MCITQAGCQVMSICMKAHKIANTAITQKKQKNRVAMESIVLVGESKRGDGKRVPYAKNSN